MFKIINKKELPGDTCLMDIEAPRIAASALPGQFIIIKMEKNSERIPLTISDHDAKKGYIRIVFKAIGKSTRQMMTFHNTDNHIVPSFRP